MNKHKKKKVFIGIDLGGTKILAGLLNKNFKILATAKAKVRVEEGEKYFLKTIEEVVHGVLSDRGMTPKNLYGIGIGCPGIIDTKKGVVISSPNIPFLNRYDLSKKIKKIFKVPVAIGNDVNVGLMGEHWFGAARGYDHAVGIFLGTGIGGALILNGKIYEGASGGAGEIGHMQIDPTGELCGCGMRGCLESIAGRVAVASEAALLAARQKAKKLFEDVGTDISKIKSGALSKAVKAGDKSIEDLIRYKSHWLGIAMANVVDLLNPEVIVLGGGMVEAMGDMIVPEAEKSMRQRAMAPLVKDVKVVQAKLKDYAIVMGAAKIASDAVLGKKED